jgi:phage terminase large subunit-like protein
VVPEDPSFYPIIYAAPNNADWRDEEVWRACNPALASFCRKTLKSLI